MLRIIQNTSAPDAKRYYAAADYYIAGESRQELAGVWKGQGARLLGLQGEVTRETWDALCDNRDPNTGSTLTARQKEPRRVGYDFNFHVPKSVSLLYGLTRDDRLLSAFRTAVNETMHDVEREMQTRVRKNGHNMDRTTGNMVWGEFVHLTSRPVEGIPDPHLHAHCFVFNTTYDAQERRWKAGQFAGLKRDGPYFEAKFHARMAGQLQALGVATQRTRTGWEIAGLEKATLDKFSRRTALIEALAAKLQDAADKEYEAALAQGQEARRRIIDKNELGASTRENKQKNLTMQELQRVWESWLTGDESAALQRTARQLGTAGIAGNDLFAKEAVNQAIDHCFERKSVVPERELLAYAIKAGIGQVSAEAVETEYRNRGLLTAEHGGRRVVTTPGVLAEEQRMIAFAKDGRGTCRPLGDPSYQIQRTWLNDDQRNAVRHVLASKDRVTAIKGGAGVGKTSMMKEAVDAIEAGGTQVFVFAPSADASRGVLREQEGFSNADTVARLLLDTDMQEAARGQVLWIDEAGLVGTRTMAALFELADRIDARVILSGDSAQHGSVERGPALRLLEIEAGLIPAEIREIQRQSGEYKRAVAALAKGDTATGFRGLDELGWIKQIPLAQREQRLASDYVHTVLSGQTALVVAPTHKEGDRVTQRIRSALHDAGMLGRQQRAFGILQRSDLTLGQRQDAVHYQPGDVIVFHQNAPGFRKGQRLVVGKDEVGGDRLPPLAQAERFQVFRPATLTLAAGDLIRITHNGKTADKKHDLRNGAVYGVKGFTPKGDIRLTNGWTVARDFGHFTHGYVVTSHASQGKTVERVFIAQSSDSFPASNKEQFYVSVSRARQDCTIYTDDKRALLEAVAHSDERLSATELLDPRRRRQLRHRLHLELEQQRHPVLQEAREQRLMSR